jgi:hypothetical protein
MVVVGVVGLREAHQISPLVWPVGQEVVALMDHILDLALMALALMALALMALALMVLALMVLVHVVQCHLSEDLDQWLVLCLQGLLAGP